MRGVDAHSSCGMVVVMVVVMAVDVRGGKQTKVGQ
jgi:hypothetical protein